MRPRLLHLGYTASILKWESHNEASMRPRLLHLGYDDHAVIDHGGIVEASMRPRLLHLGYQESLAFVAGYGMLQ